MQFFDQLPGREELAQYRIWDAHLHVWPFPDEGRSLTAQMEEDIAPFAQRMGIERLCAYLHVGLGTSQNYPNPDEVFRAKMERENRELLARWPDLLLGFVWLNPNRVEESLQAIDYWVGEGPMVALKFGGGTVGTLKCNHPNFYPMVERAAKMEAVIYQHTWLKAGGDPIRPGGGNNPGESTPQELVELARRYPAQPFICGHAGGDWEVGIRAVRSTPNVWLEIAGNDPTDGIVQMAVRELGANRVIFGGHLPSRSYGTELSKVLGAGISRREKELILGENLRTLLAPQLRKKGIPI